MKLKTAGYFLTASWAAEKPVVLCAVPNRPRCNRLPRIAFMPRRPPQFVYLSVEAFRNLTPHQKQEYLEELKNHLDDPIRYLTGDPSRPEDPSHTVEH